jgi:hypothetical protein
LTRSGSPGSPAASAGVPSTAGASSSNRSGPGPAATRSPASLVLLQGFAVHQFIEITFPSAGRLVLHQQSKILLVKFAEPVVPANLLKRVLATVASKVETNDPDIADAARAFYPCRPGVTLLRPASNFVVIGKWLWLMLIVVLNCVSLNCALWNCVAWECSLRKIIASRRYARMPCQKSRWYLMQLAMRDQSTSRVEGFWNCAV